MANGRRAISAIGTWAPVLLLILGLFAYLDSMDGDSTIEFLVLYPVTFISFLQGIWALIQMARYPVGRYPTAFTLTFLYQKILTALVLGAAAADRIGILHLSDAHYAVLITMSFCAHIVFNEILYFGRTRDLLEVESDPVPFRQIWRRVREGNRRMNRMEDRFRAGEKRRDLDDARRRVDDRRRDADDARRAEDDKHRDEGGGP